MGKPTLLLSITALLITLLFIVSCSGETAETVTITQTQTSTVTTIVPGATQTVTSTTSIMLLDTINGYYSAVLLLESYAIRVNVGFYNANKGNPVLLERDDPRFAELLQYLKDCSSGKVTPKTTTIVENDVTRTVHVTILYGHDRFLDFTLSDGTTIRFTVADEVWFETVDTIYNAKYYDSAFHDFLETILPKP